MNPNKAAEMFYGMIEDSSLWTFPLGVKVSKLPFIIHILHMKSVNNWSDKSFQDLVNFLREHFPDRGCNTKFLLLYCCFISKMVHIAEDSYNWETTKDDPHNFLMYQLTGESKLIEVERLVIVDNWTSIWWSACFFKGKMFFLSPDCKRWMDLYGVFFGRLSNLNVESALSFNLSWNSLCIYICICQE